MAGPELESCLDALVDRGAMEIEEAVDDAVDDALDDVGLGGGGGGCTAGGRGGLGGLVALFGFGLALFARRRR